MTTKTKGTTEKIPEGLNESDLKTMYEAMVLTRAYDDRCLKLQRQGRIAFYAGSFGEEACQIGTAYALAERDWIFSSYRQPGVALFRGVSMQEMMNNLFGNAEDVVMGRQMPVHYSSRKNHFLSISSVVASQVPQAAGCAMAAKIKGDDCVTITYFGDGGTSTGDFHAGMNFASVFKAPCIFVLINNQFAISTPVVRQTGVETLAEKAKAYGMPGYQVDGNDVLAVYEATVKAVQRARNGEGPTLLELKTFRAGPHSSSDDPSRYRNQKDYEEWLKRDPITVLKQKLEDMGVWTQEFEDTVWEQVNKRINDAVKVAEQLPQPTWDTLFDDVYSYMSQTLQEQKADIMAHEQGLELTNEGEFPL